MKRQAGFTLVELIIVIVVLGILAAYAVPKFMSVDKEARAAVVKGLGGSVRTASDMVHALAIAQGKATLAGGVAGAEVVVGSGSVEINLGYAQPTLDGIAAALNDLSDFNVTENAATKTITFTHKNTLTDNATTCRVVYTYDPTVAGLAIPSVAVAATNCG